MSSKFFVLEKLFLKKSFNYHHPSKLFGINSSKIKFNFFCTIANTDNNDNINHSNDRDNSNNKSVINSILKGSTSTIIDNNNNDLSNREPRIKEPYISRGTIYIEGKAYPTDDFTNVTPTIL